MRFRVLLVVSKAPWVSQILIAHVALRFRLFIWATVKWPLDSDDRRDVSNPGASDLFRSLSFYGQHAHLRIFIDDRYILRSGDAPVEPKTSALGAGVAESLCSIVDKSFRED
jgi:hypothetical protein